MSGHTRPHGYRDGVKGRSIRTGVRGLFGIAIVQCTACPATGEVRLRELMGQEQIDQKMRQRGWRLDPHRCPLCQQKAKEGRVATNPSPAAMRAQATMFRLLDAHFDMEKGSYEKDWNDERVAKEAGLAINVVQEFRRAGFGELKLPTEVERLHLDIEALAALKRESDAQFDQELARLRAAVAEVKRKFVA